MSGKKIAEVSFVIFLLCAALGVFIMFYMHSDAQRAAEIEAYLNYKYGITVDENEGVTFNGDEFSLVTSDKITVLGICDYFGEVQMESYVNYYYADECVAQINEKIGDCFSDCVIVYDGISLSELASFQYNTSSINSYEEYVAVTKNAWETAQEHKYWYKISVRVYVRESDYSDNVNEAIARLQDSDEYFDVFFFKVPDELFDLHKEKGVYAYFGGEALKDLETGLDRETCVELEDLISNNAGMEDMYCQWNRSGV